MLDAQERVQKEQGLISRIAKFSGKEPVNTYLCNMEHNLEQDGILPARWLRILENTLSGEALHAYWNVFTTEQRESYAAAKATLTAWQGETAHGCIDRFMNGRKKFQDTPMQVFQDSISLTKLLMAGNESKEESIFTFAMARILAGYTKECAEHIWKKKLKMPGK